jgi:hypothetical protein
LQHACAEEQADRDERGCPSLSLQHQLTPAGAGPRSSYFFFSGAGGVSIGRTVCSTGHDARRLSL